jgi:hypothetical protein
MIMNTCAAFANCYGFLSNNVVSVSILNLRHNLTQYNGNISEWGGREGLKKCEESDYENDY